MKEGSLKNILNIAVPVAAERILLLLTGLAGIIIIGRVGTQELVVVSIANTIYEIIQSMFTGLSVGAAILVTRFSKTENHDEASCIMYHTLLINFAISIFVLLISAVAGERILNLLFQNMTPSIRLLSEQYFRISLWAVPLMGVDIGISACFRGAGNAKLPLYLTICTNVVNILLGILLVFVLKMGIQGVAVAFLISRMLGGIMRLAAVFCGRFELKIRRLYKFSARYIKLIVSYGNITMCEQLMLQLGFLGMQLITAHISEMAVGGYQLANNVVNIIFAVSFGFETAQITLAGVELGRNAKKEAKTIACSIFKLNEIITCLLSVPMLLFPKYFLMIFSSDPELISNGIPILRILLLFVPLTSFFQGIQGAIKTGGRAAIVLLLNLISPWLIRIPIAYFLCVYCNLGILGLMAGLLVDYLVRDICYFIEFRKEKWLNTNII